ncbi:hypothetical protein HNP84_000543 [Thermocatellispora tengchongensis]|uniref:Uncharacterized protein n=1 Tax=Thermocatellispora tengchongensis TaxID=1073253 RepID=A0A840P487_9ACTN|nr:hypothetical protein [Thermocatellispora tengchongensis]MBB5130855.1 hypothetical protein [Thermocatellispora tengchongensis]
MPLSALTLVFTAFSAPARAESDDDAALALAWQVAWDTYRFYEWVTEPLPWDGRSRVSRDISIDIDAPVQRVFDAYSDVNNHIGMHSFLKRIVTHKDWTEGATRYVNFTAIEDIPVAGVPVTSRTHAQQRIHRDELYYETDTWTLPNVVTHQRIVFQDLGGGRTRVTEHLTFEASVLLIDFTVTNGVASHQATQAGLKAAIENGDI